MHQEALQVGFILSDELIADDAEATPRFIRELLRQKLLFILVLCLKYFELINLVEVLERYPVLLYNELIPVASVHLFSIAVAHMHVLAIDDSNMQNEFKDAEGDEDGDIEQASLHVRIGLIVKLQVGYGVRKALHRLLDQGF